MIRKTTNVRNSGWNLVNILLYPALFLAATPYFIDKLSASVFGEWMLINSYIYISVHLMGFGLPDSITAHVARAIGLQDRKKLYAYINASGSLLGKMASISLLVALLLLVLYLTRHTTLFGNCRLFAGGYIFWKPGCHGSDHRVAGVLFTGFDA
ncbi:MAG: hypothetical protein P8100_09990 [bacterium]